jgi:hypothetical protein
MAMKKWVDSVENEYGERHPVKGHWEDDNESERKAVVQMGNDLIDREKKITELKQLITELADALERINPILKSPKLILIRHEIDDLVSKAREAGK